MLAVKSGIAGSLIALIFADNQKPLLGIGCPKGYAHRPVYAIMNAMSQRNEIEELQAQVMGRVQGVGFRQFVVRHALTLGLRGYARNEEEDGSVEVLAQGPRPSLEHLLTYLRQGPSAADVAEVRVRWGQPTQHKSGFHIRF